MEASLAPAPMSWSDIANWDKAPDLPPPPPPSQRGGAGPQFDSDECMDPACVDPMCAPLQKRVEGQPRAADMGAETVRLQEAMLGLAKDNKADEIRQLCSKGLSAAYGNSIGQTALHIAGIWNAVEAGEALLDHGALIDAKNDLSGATRMQPIFPASCCRYVPSLVPGHAHPAVGMPQRCTWPRCAGGGSSAQCW
eukprot:COSAG02_NODE_1481_length_12389_cov_15.643857_3_plen_195_part_00